MVEEVIDHNFTESARESFYDEMRVWLVAEILDNWSNSKTKTSTLLRLYDVGTREDSKEPIARTT